MTVEEYLKTNKSINISALAKLMWPENKHAGSRLLTKLSNKSPRPFTDEDTRLAISALKSIGKDWEKIDGFDK